MLERVTSLALMAALATFMVACEEGPTSPDAEGVRVQVGFRAARVAPAATPATTAPAAPARASAGEVEIVGTNGTLTITDVRFIVSEFELERDDGDCGETAEDDRCEEIEGGPLFLALPLDGETAPAVERKIRAGMYEEVEFEIEDLELDDDEDEADGRAIAELLARIRSDIPDWPEQASLMAAGRFTPTDGEPADFRAFFEAEIEIEREFEPPLRFDEGAAITVVVDPEPWFRRPDGTVTDLSALDFERSGRVVELEAELEDGFTEVEIDTE